MTAAGGARDNERDTERVEAQAVATPPSMPALDGKGRPVLPGYQLLERLGSGRSSVVWKAQLVGGFRPVAIKVLRHELMDDSAVVRSFMSEGRLLAQLEADHGEHPHLVPVYDVGTFGHHLCILMKYLPQGDLAGYVAGNFVGGRVSDARIFLDFALQITAGVAYLHANGILHRDIKPVNVFVDRLSGKMALRLGDLGLATDLGHGDAATGTPLYMAPEGFLRQQATTQTDVYALGVTMFQLLTGQPPYRSATLSGLSHLVRVAPVPQVYRFAPELPRAISDLIGVCMRKDPARRYRDGAAVLAALCAVRDQLNLPPQLADTGDDSTWR
jgi:serine/threonine protein kinase